jgi:hypothetical protein
MPYALNTTYIVALCMILDNPTITFHPSVIYFNANYGGTSFFYLAPV